MTGLQLDRFEKTSIITAVVIGVVLTIVIFTIDQDIKRIINEIKEAGIALDNKAKVHCHEEGFYNGNFARCERLGITP